MFTVPSVFRRSYDGLCDCRRLGTSTSEMIGHATLTAITITMAEIRLKIGYLWHSVILDIQAISNDSTRAIDNLHNGCHPDDLSHFS